MKWEGFSHFYNTWEPHTNLTNCQAAIDEFELKWARDIVGMNGSDFCVRFKCGEIRQVTEAEARTKWPVLLNVFLKKNPEIVNVSNRTNNSHSRQNEGKLEHVVYFFYCGK